MHSFGGEHDPDEHLQTDRLFITQPSKSPEATNPAHTPVSQKKTVPMDVDEAGDEPATDSEEDGFTIVKDEAVVEDDDDDDEPRPLSSASGVSRRFDRHQPRNANPLAGMHAD